MFLFAEITGLQIKVFESEAVDGIHIGKNGSFNVNTSEMEIDLYSGNEGQGIMLHTASHELVHFIRQWSAEKYKVLADFLTEQYGKKGVSTDTLVNRQIEKAEAAGRKISYAEAHEEVIADSMEAMLDDGSVIEKLQMLQAKDKTLFEKIKNYLADLVKKIKKAYKDVRPETVEGEIISSMLDKTEQLQQLFVEAIAGAIENFKNAEVVEVKTNENNQVKYSLAPIDEESKYNAISRGHAILETSEDVIKAIDKSLKDKSLKKSYILGGIPSDVKNKISKDTNENIFKKGGYVFKITSDHIRHIKKHFQNTEDILDAVYRLYDVVCNYDSVSPIQNGNQTRLKFEKSYWDYSYLSIEVASKKSRCLDLVTFYITKNNKKKESKIQSPAKSQDLAHQGVSLSNNTVPQNGTDVNASISKKGIKYSDRSQNGLKENKETKQSDNRYSYDVLVNKPDMKVTVVEDTVKYNPSKETRKNVINMAIKNAASIGYTNENGNAVVHVKDIDTDVIVPKRSIVHGLDRRLNVQSAVLTKIGEILESSIEINELVPRGSNIEKSYALIGVANSKENQYVVSFVVNRFTNEVSSIDVLYAVNTKKEPAALLPKITEKSATPTDSTISISDLLDYVNRYFPDILPEDVLKHYGHTSRPNGKLGESALFSDRDPNALTPRNLLANALESSAVHEVEKKKLAEYKKNINNLYVKEQELYEVRKQIKEIYNAPGKRDTVKLKQLRERATELSNNIDVYDKKLLNLESTSFLKNASLPKVCVLR